MKEYLFIYISLVLISFINCYNSSFLKNITKADLERYSKDNGYEGCYALYDSGANDTETCTQFKLEYPYICCRVHYEIDDFKNDFCMPIANNTKSLSDVENAFQNAKNVEIDCNSTNLKIPFYLFVLLFFYSIMNI